MEPYTARIENWSVGFRPDPYLPPEMMYPTISGMIYEDKKGRWEDGHNITTSSIIDTNGRIIITKSGSQYLLGKPNKDYVKWCNDNNHSSPLNNPNNPVVFINE